jgi:hypothetical protein
LFERYGDLVFVELPPEEKPEEPADRLVEQKGQKPSEDQEPNKI